VASSLLLLPGATTVSHSIGREYAALTARGRGKVDK